MGHWLRVDSRGHAGVAAVDGHQHAAETASLGVCTGPAGSLGELEVWAMGR